MRVPCAVAFGWCGSGWLLEALGPKSGALVVNIGCAVGAVTLVRPWSTMGHEVAEPPPASSSSPPDHGERDLGRCDGTRSSKEEDAVWDSSSAPMQSGSVAMSNVVDVTFTDVDAVGAGSS